MDLIDRDLKHVWHPCSQMKDYETFKPIEISHAKGSYVYQANGKPLIDAISSWWCKSLGHSDERLQQALYKQAQSLEHTILANTTNETIVTLSENICNLAPHINKVMYASDGSCAVEMAIKMALHAQQLRDQGQRQQFAALANGYHGETCMTLSVSDLGIYREPYEPLLYKSTFINKVPYVTGTTDPLWSDCESHWLEVEKQLTPIKDSLCAIIIEPLLQGAGGMLVYSADFLKRLASFAKANNIFLIADEILTGFGRTGTPLACEQANIEADFVCLSKGLTAGMLPMSAMATTDAIYDLFYDDYEKGKSFLHSHTHTGNTLAAAVANAVFDIYQADGIYEKMPGLSAKLHEQMQWVADKTGKLGNIRHIGGMVAADIMDTNLSRAGYQVYQEAMKHGAILRPLGNTLYWLPPLNISHETVEQLAEITWRAVENVL